MPEPYRSFREFYPFYLSEHRDRTCRRLHVVGSALVLACLALALFTLNAWWLLGAVLAGCTASHGSDTSFSSTTGPRLSLIRFTV